MWHHLRIEDPAEASHTSLKMMEAVALLQDLTDNNEVALFSRFDTMSGDMHYYFTPAAQSVAKVFHATPCSKPTRAQAGGADVGAYGLPERLWPDEAPIQN